VSRPRRPSTDQRIASALRRLAKDRPLDEIRLTELAREAGVSWPTVKRHIGDRRRLRELAEAEYEQPAHGHTDARARLLAAAERVFGRQGFAAATLDDIAADAGLSKGAVYWHFESKRDLFVSLFDERMASDEQADHVVTHRDARQSLYQLLGKALGRAQSSRDHARLVLEFASELRVPEVRARLVALLGRRDAETAQRLSELQREQVIDPELDPELAARLLAATATGLLVLSLADPALDLPTLLPEIARMLERGLGASLRR
jgi:AcrR family transcriptional regulator